jgi:DNA-binding LacI/PurR family transcriptional regulator
MSNEPIDPKSPPRNPRMIDVAQLAGVSHQTVSRVLNASPAVRPEVTQRVQRAIQLLGYKRNPAARTLASRRSMNLGVITFGVSLYGPSLTLFGIADAARQLDYTSSLITLADVNQDTLRDAFEHLREVAVDGVIVVAPVAGASDMIRSLAGNLPLVAFEPGVEERQGSVAIDEVLAARLATRHLLELGHETVWHLSGPAGWLGAEARIRGWREELSAARRVAYSVYVGEDWSAAAGYRLARRIAANRDATAVFVANDQMALGLMHGLREAGRRVPEEVSVVGFDDVPEAAFFQPALTTVRLDFDAVGRACVSVLMELMGARAAGAATPPAPELIVRASTAPPSA